MAQFSLLLAVNLVVLGLIFLYVRGKVRKALEMEGLMDNLRKEVGELVRDLNQTTDRNITLLEDSLRALKQATEEADRRVTVLRREAERRSTESAVYDRLGRLRSETAASVPPETPLPSPEFEIKRPAPAVSGPAVVERRAADIPKSPSAATSDAEKDSNLGPGDSASIPFVSFSSSPIRPKPPVRDEVLSLSRRGISSELIAAKLGITVAEVELIVSLEEQKGLLSREEDK